MFIPVVPTKSKHRHGLSESATVFSCYEAGRDGFWLHRALLSEGIENIVVDPSSVAVDRRARRAKTDRLDAEKLLRHLIRFQEDPQEWRVVRVPSVEDEDERHLHRELSRLKRERTQHTNLIKSLLVLHGVAPGGALDLLGGSNPAVDTEPSARSFDPAVSTPSVGGGSDSGRGERAS